MAKKLARNAELVTIKSVRDQLEDVFKAVEKGFADQADRSNENSDWWDIWNCRIGSNQFYSGNSKVFLPMVRNAIKARKVRFVDQLFPQSQRNVAVISHDDESPDAQVALIEHYIRRDKLRSVTVPALMVAGDVEGQMTVCVTWDSHTRNVVDRIPEPIRALGIDLPPEMGTIERTREEAIDDEGPTVEVVLDSDVCVLPATADAIDEALDIGGSVTILRRWDRKRLDELIDDGELHASSVEELLTAMTSARDQDQEKKNLDAAGIKGRGEHALVYRTWCKLKLPGEKEKRLCLAYWAGGEHYLSCRLCPYWCDLPDVISHPRDKLAGNFKGQSQLKPGVADMQIAANDALNEGLDSLTYSLLPPIRYDPEQVRNVDALVMDLMALWPAPAGSIEQLKFEQVMPHALETVIAAERMINMSLSVSPTMIPQSSGVRKRSQAEIAMEQQLDIQMTADVVIETEEAMMTEIVDRFARYDLQFREKEVTVRAYGEFGIEVEMMRVPSQQQGRRWEYLWHGVEANRTAAQVQQQIAAANVLRGLAQDPSIALAGKRLNMVPIVQLVVESAFSPRIAPKIFQDIASQITVPPELENQMLAFGHEVHVSPLDNDPQHIQAHMQALQRMAPGTPAAFQTMAHLQHHQQQIKMKGMAAAGAQAQQIAGQPGGQPGPQRLPQQGGQPAMPRQGRQPPGRIAPDQLAKTPGVIQMPRRAGAGPPIM